MLSPLKKGRRGNIFRAMKFGQLLFSILRNDLGKCYHAMINENDQIVLNEQGI